MSFIVKNTTFPGFLDLFAPHSCRGCGKIGTPLCDCCKNHIYATKFDLCPNCKATITSPKCPHCHDLPPIYTIGERSDLLNTLIHDYKYNSNRTLSKVLASLMASRLPTLPEGTILIPLPTTASHIRSRGFDHTYLIAKHLTKNIRNLKVKKLLLRANNTTQVGSNHHTRLAQAEHAYQVNPRLPINPDTTYVLFDDVWTTGASMKSAVKKLRQAGAKNIIIALLSVSRLD